MLSSGHGFVLWGMGREYSENFVHFYATVISTFQFFVRFGKLSNNFCYRNDILWTGKFSEILEFLNLKIFIWF